MSRCRYFSLTSLYETRCPLFDDDDRPGSFDHDHTELFAYTNKSTQHPKYLRQAALEVIDSIHEGTILIYTDSIKNQEYIGSGAFIKFGNEEILLKGKY
ncbi:hypothetical protein TNCT_564331 [Trichonephila clavata]|uniref:Uncharacterized protein n=1 Tax=Trichonephila clavata TaxID=2740835 RepID=A0A8X6I036_TRICU|nr:hypothetical protein TNCT_564331 [Trichonephila clavata]